MLGGVAPSGATGGIVATAFFGPGFGVPFPFGALPEQLYSKPIPTTAVTKTPIIILSGIPLFVFSSLFIIASAICEVEFILRL
jgi:hypothetical protein